MNRVDRLLGIVLELQSRKTQRAEDLGATFGVGKRTIYRDIQALSEMGVPIVALPGQGYALDEGYFLPPLSFSTDEAMSLLLGAEFINNVFDAQYQYAAHSASNKITALLSERHRREIAELEASLKLVAVNVLDDLLPHDQLQQLRRAILQRRTVRFAYHARSPEDVAGTKTRREADPYALVHYAGHWYLWAFCHLRHEERNFRLDRLSQLEVTPHSFERPANFVLREHHTPHPHVIQLLFTPEVAQWVREDRFYFVTAYEMTPDGLLVTLRVQHNSDAIRWILGWGSQVQVLSPASLQERIAQEAHAILRLYQVPESLLT